MKSIRDKAQQLTLFTALVAMGALGSPLIVDTGSLAWADDGGGMVMTPQQKRRAQQLFRNYCMDCHGPKLTGEKFDKTLLCPNVQGKGVGSYQDAIQSGPSIMPAFRVYTGIASDGNLILNYDDFILLSNHEATFQSNQP